jgi:hypothetical protein
LVCICCNSALQWIVENSYTFLLEYGSVLLNWYIYLTLHICLVEKFVLKWLCYCHQIKSIHLGPLFGAKLALQIKIAIVWVYKLYVWEINSRRQERKPLRKSRENNVDHRTGSPLHLKTHPTKNWKKKGGRR